MNFNISRINKMQTYLVFDVETTGINNYKHLVQLSWFIFSIEHRRIVYANNVIVNSKYCSTDSALSIHGITEEYRNKYGIDEKDALKLFEDSIHKYMSNNPNSGFVCHDESFDIDVLISTAIGNNLYNFIKTIRKYKMYNTKSSNIYIESKMKDNNNYTNLEKSVGDRINNASKYVGKKYATEWLQLKPHNAMYDTLLCWILFCESTTIDCIEL